MSQRKEKKLRTCKVCQLEFETTAKEIKTHAETCKGVSDASN